MDTMEALIRVCLSTAFVDGWLSPPEIEGIKNMANRAGAHHVLQKILKETAERRHGWQTMDDMLRWLEPALKTIDNASPEVRFMASLMVERVAAVDNQIDSRESELTQRLKARITQKSEAEFSQPQNRDSQGSSPAQKTGTRTPKPPADEDVFH